MKIPNKLLIVLILIVFISENILAQEENKVQEFKHFRMAFALGHAYIPKAKANDSKTLIIPTMGIDLQYWFNSKWGVALKNDLEIANYTVELPELNEDRIIRETPLIIALPVLFSPWENGITFLLGPGIEIEKNENFSILRLGIGYEFEIGNEWDFAPEFIYDLKNENINSFTIAIGIGKRF